MNFLAHYYFDKQQDAHYNLGLIFPDILRNFVKGAKLQLHLLNDIDHPELALRDGCLQHTETDKVFHDWAGFHQWMDFILLRIRGNSQIKRDWFVAHILAELALDHYLLIQDPKLANALYTDLNKTDRTALDRFLQKQGLQELNRFNRGYDHFMSARYLEMYTESRNIVFGLGKICTKMNLEPFSQQQEALLVAIVEELLPEIDAKLPSLKEKL